MTPKNATCQASLSLIISWSLPKFMLIASVMPPKHLILCHPLLLLPSIFASLRVFYKELAKITIGLFPTFPLSSNPQYFLTHWWWSFLTLFIFQVQTDRHVCIHTHSIHLCSSYRAWRICSPPPVCSILCCLIYSKVCTLARFHSLFYTFYTVFFPKVAVSVTFKNKQ